MNETSDSATFNFTTTEGFQFRTQFESSLSEQEKWWIAPRNMRSMKFFVACLLDAGLKEVIASIASLQKIEDPIVYTAGFMLVGPTKKWPEIHTDGPDRKCKRGSILIPIKLLDGSGPEILIQKSDDTFVQVKYSANAALYLPEDLPHQTTRQEGRWFRHQDLRIMLDVAIGPAELPKKKKELKELAIFMTPFYPWPEGDDIADEGFVEWVSNWVDEYKKINFSSLVKKEKVLDKNT